MEYHQPNMAQDYRGTIQFWDKEKGFGFIDSDYFDERLFVHGSEIFPKGYVPFIGEHVSFMVGNSPDKKIWAKKVVLIRQMELEEPITPNPSNIDISTSSGELKPESIKFDWSLTSIAYIVAMVIFLEIVHVFCTRGSMPIIVFYGYMGMNIWSLFLYIKDKRAALNDLWRVPEKTLLWSSVLGGWPAALCIQNIIRHKNQKTEFKQLFIGTIILNIIAFSILAFFSKDLNAYFAYIQNLFGVWFKSFSS
ncbi:DUF1294 domain-containing protein [Neisseria sp. Ec49-e6-T10]|uniref:DUF1294 domain-containing protein n=1 Tax=Neisseria sp. Ec49-e6-T10 TaxID=3140744 RepID=UPI003EBA4555